MDSENLCHDKHLWHISLFAMYLANLNPYIRHSTIKMTLLSYNNFMHVGGNLHLF